MTKIIIGYSSKIHESLINNYRKGISSDIIIESYVQEKRFSADGEFIPLVISFIHAFSEGLVSGFGEYVFKSIMDKTSDLIKGHVKYKQPPTKFQINIKDENKIQSFKAENVTPENVDNALKEFRKMIIATNNKKAGDQTVNYFDAAKNVWTSDVTSIEYFKKMDEEANQNPND